MIPLLHSPTPSIFPLGNLDSPPYEQTPLHFTMPSGMCKFCTHHFFHQLNSSKPLRLPHYDRNEVLCGFCIKLPLLQTLLIYGSRLYTANVRTNSRTCDSILRFTPSHVTGINISGIGSSSASSKYVRPRNAKENSETENLR